MATADNQAVTGELLGLLLDIRQEQRAIRRLLEQRKLSRGDRVLLGRILPVIAGAIGSEWFTVSELYAHSGAALAVALKGVRDSRLGSALSRGEGIDVNGLVVRRGGKEAGGVVWRVEAVIGASE